MHQPLTTFTVDALAVRVYATAQALAEDAARLARQRLADAIREQGHAAAILASASSQIRFLEALLRPGGPDWSRARLFHMDEYLGLEGEHPASFGRFMRERVEQPARPGAMHYLRGDAPEPLDECERYAALLRAQPMDLCCLGIGENGHVAFNDPGVANFEDPRLVKLVRLDEACRRQQVGEGHFPDLAAVPRYAFTLTVPALCAARAMLCIVPEKRKAPAVQAALRGPITPDCPASILRRQAHCTLLLDRDSASAL